MGEIPFRRFFKDNGCILRMVNMYSFAGVAVFQGMEIGGRGLMSSFSAFFGKIFSFAKL